MRTKLVVYILPVPVYNENHLFFLVIKGRVRYYIFIFYSFPRDFSKSPFYSGIKSTLINITNE